MSVTDYTIAGLQKAREELIAIPRDQLTPKAMTDCLIMDSNNIGAIQRAEPGSMLLRRISHAMRDLDTAPTEVLEDARKTIVDHIDASIQTLDSSRRVRSILEERILKVKDTKLAALLQEFNRTREVAPNLAAIAFRTVLSLVIVERAKIAAPGSALAIKQDLQAEPDIKAAISSKIFDAGNTRLLDKYQQRMNKDVMDIVAHKTGANAMVHKDDLSAAIEMLNSLLAEII